MTVHFIGAGPGAADLITVRGLRLLQRCPVVLYAGALVPQELLDECAPEARLVDTAHLDLDQIVGEIRAAHEAGQDVARLQSGDLSVFSAVAEQVRRLEELGIDYAFVPGVPAFAAAAAALRRELTVPTVGQTIILTRLSRNATAMPEHETIANLGRSRALIALHLATHLADEVVQELGPHYGLDCPAAVVAMASRPEEVVWRGTLGELGDAVRDHGLRRTAIILVGQVLAASEFRDSHLYSRERDRHDCTLPPPIGA